MLHCENLECWRDNTQRFTAAAMLGFFSFYVQYDKIKNFSLCTLQNPQCRVKLRVLQSVTDCVTVGYRCVLNSFLHRLLQWTERERERTKQKQQQKQTEKQTAFRRQTFTERFFKRHKCIIGKKLLVRGEVHAGLLCDLRAKCLCLCVCVCVCVCEWVCVM